MPSVFPPLDLWASQAGIDGVCVLETAKVSYAFPKHMTQPKHAKEKHEARHSLTFPFSQEGKKN